MIPAGHGFFGKSFVSGNRVLMVCRQVYVNCGNLSAWARVSAAGDPIIIRNPLLALAVLGEYSMWASPAEMP
jgi:hypothetical protein